MIKSLNDRIRSNQAEENGFTLIELLIVIVILGVLAAVVVFSVGGIDDRGQASACKAETATLKTAQEAYYAKNGTYANSSDALKGTGFLGTAPSWHETSGSGAVSITNTAKCSV